MNWLLPLIIPGFVEGFTEDGASFHRPPSGKAPQLTLPAS